jgi:amino acid transporter
MNAPERLGLIRALSLWDVVAMNIVAVVGLRWIARSARADAPSVTLWMLAAILFFLPLAVALANLSRRYPGQGGIYAWTRRAFGPLHGFICGWCLWVNNLFYFPSLLLFGAANLTLALGSAGTGLDDSRAYSLLFVLGFLWLVTLLNIVGLTAGKWLQNAGSIATWIPAALLIVCGAVAFGMFGSATSFAPERLMPRDDFWATMSLWSAMCFAFSGFEIASMVALEVKDPERTIPRAILLSGAAITVIYILGSASVLVAVPAGALSERSGISDAVDLVTARLGLAGLGGFTGLLLAIGSIGGVSSWVAGAARVPFAAGVDAVMPAALSRLHPRFRTPHVALIVQAMAASALFLSSVYLSVGGADTTIQEAYDILVNLTILVYFLPYLYLFASFIRLRRAADSGVDSRWDEGWAAVPAAAAGFSATLIAMILVFVPPPGTENVWNYEANLIGQTAVILGVGFACYATARRR